MSTSSSGGQASQGKTVASNTRDLPINIQELTERVYLLLLKDVETQRKRMYGTRR